MNWSRRLRNADDVRDLLTECTCAANSGTITKKQLGALSRVAMALAVTTHTGNQEAASCNLQALQDMVDRFAKRSHPE